MKIWLLIIILFFTIFLIENVNSVGESGEGPKLYKSFDEIFGKGWDDESNDSKDLNCRHIKKEDQDRQAPNTSDQKNIDEIFGKGWDNENNDSKDLNCRHVKEEDQDVQAPNTSDQKKIDEILKQKFDEIYAENWSEDEHNSAPDQDESVDEQQNESNECEKIDSDQQKREIVQKFREMKENYKKNRKYSTNEWHQIHAKISNDLGVSRTTLYKWIKELGLNQEKFSEFEKREILKQFDKIKSKCKKAKLKNISMRELDNKIARKLGVCSNTITLWKRKFGLSVSNKKISDATKIGILKKYSKIKGKNPKMSDCDIADLLKTSKSNLCKWKVQFKDEIKNL